MTSRGFLFAGLFLSVITLATGVFTQSAFANHKDGHVDQGTGNIDLTQFDCKQFGAIECILFKLERLEKRLGCPIDDYLADTCQHSPADTSATFCISQGREGSIAAKWGAEMKAEIEAGAGWPNAVWGKATGKVEVPVVLPPLLPIPTELAVNGEAALGRNFDICITVPLIAFNQTTVGEFASDEEIIDRIVRAINSPQLFNKSKFQRRLGRIANYAIFRVPGANRFDAVTGDEHASELALALHDDGESEFDFVDSALDQVMAGEWGTPDDGGVLQMLKSASISDLSSVLEVPTPVRNLLANPDTALGGIFRGPGAANTAAFDGVSANAALGICDAYGLNDQLRAQFPGIASFCNLFGVLPTLSQTTGIYALVQAIRNIVGAIPTLSEIISAACDIAGWNCGD